MNRDEQEMALWRKAYMLAMSQDTDPVNESGLADAAVAEFRTRYPAEPAADDNSDNAGATTLIALLDDIAGDSAFSGFGQSMQSRIYAAIEAMRKGQPAAPAAVWYDAPPRPGEYHVEGLPCVCWVDEDVVWCPVWDLVNERPLIRELPLAGRRVSPIAKPPETTT